MTTYETTTVDVEELISYQQNTWAFDFVKAYEKITGTTADMNDFNPGTVFEIMNEAKLWFTNTNPGLQITNN